MTTACESARVDINPAGLDAASYIAFLNQSFPGQWDRAAYDWYIGRSFNGKAGDILVQADGVRLLSGMAMLYRQISVDARSVVNVAVIGAAATSPAERGRGRYQALLQAALERAREQACAAILAFVTHDNGSARGLIRLGARAIPSFYIVSNNRPHGAERPPGDDATHDRAASPAMDELLAQIGHLKPRLPTRQGTRCSGGWAWFHYERQEDWRRQFIDRPNTVRAMRPVQDSLALVESVHGTNRLQWLACPDERIPDSIATLAVASALTKRDFFMYTLDPQQAAVARQAGLEIRDGYLLLQPTDYSGSDWKSLTEAEWFIQSGDRL